MLLSFLSNISVYSETTAVHRWFHLVVTCLSRSTKLLYHGPVSTWMGDHLLAGKASEYVPATEVDSAFYPQWDGKMSNLSISFWLSTNKWR